MADLLRPDAAANRLLLVDDEPEFGTFIRRIAEGLGFSVTVTTHPQTFKEAYVHARPDILVLDLVMPDTDGVELLRWLASQNCRERILISSGVEGRVLEAARRVGLERGLNILGTIIKPVRAKALKETLSELISPPPALPTRDDLERALTERELFVLYQPKVQLATGRLYGVEALVRWRHPVRGVLSPDTFVPLAEASGLIDALSDYVLEETIAQQKGWADAGEDLQVAVNLSPLNLHDEALADAIAARCRRHGVPTERVTIEVTESAAMNESLQALDILTRLRLKGFRLSIDDFGTGYSSLTRLQRLPVTEIKVDRSFVRDCLTSKDSYAIVKTVIDLAHNLDLVAVAEGIETAEDYRLLVKLGCEFGQGFGIARPLPAPELSLWRSCWIVPSP